MVCFSDDDDDFRERRSSSKDFQDYDWDRGDRSRDRNRDDDDFGDSDRKRDRQFKDEFRDNDEYTSVEQTQTTRTEKIVTNRRTRSVGKKLDLGAAATVLGGQESKVTIHLSTKSLSRNCVCCVPGVYVFLVVMMMSFLLFFVCLFVLYPHG